MRVRRPDEQPAMLCTEEEIDAGGKFIKEQDDLNGQISELIGRTIQLIKKESTVNDRKKYPASKMLLFFETCFCSALP